MSLNTGCWSFICNDLIKMKMICLVLLPELRTKNAIYGIVTLTIMNIN